MLLAVLALALGREEKHEFKAEVGRLMDIIINSLYTQKEIFLRELISNASDALDKLKYQHLHNGTEPGELEIRVDWNDEDKWISIRDNGIGMTKADLVQQLGTIAKTGTTEFVEALKVGDVNLIGQFGVGFYSAFLVGSRVQVRSKHLSDKAHLWESESAKAFKVTEDSPDFTQGTEVKIFLKEDAY